MYLPFLRGKQFELLALRELVSLPLKNLKISPIIEPVKIDLKSIETAVKALHAIDLNVQLIVNPEQGELKKNFDEILNFISRIHALGLRNVIPTYLIGNEKDFQFFKKSVGEYSFIETGYSLIHLNQIKSSDELKAIANKSRLVFNVINVNHLFALKRGFPPGSLAFLSDPFIKQKRNVDYDEMDDEVFSSDCFYYKSEGFVAFSDYLTIGSEFNEGGALPYAVVIHLTYKDKHNDSIRIRHFLSDSNQDSSDTAGKFGEALNKLVRFVDSERIHTVAAELFRDYYYRGAFPGLGVVKKLSIMHHIELIQNYI